MEYCKTLKFCLCGLYNVYFAYFFCRCESKKFKARNIYPMYAYEIEYRYSQKSENLGPQICSTYNMHKFMKIKGPQTLKGYLFILPVHMLHVYHFTSTYPDTSSFRRLSSFSKTLTSEAGKRILHVDYKTFEFLTSYYQLHI